MGSNATSVSLDEYLNTSYEPDMEFVDGVLVGRNVGIPPHSELQLIVGAYFRQYRNTHRIKAFTEARLRVTALRHRIPDVLVVETPYQRGKVITEVPVITVEVKSPDDTFDEIVDKCFEYQALGVRNILVMDPDHRRAWMFEQNYLRVLPGGSVQLNLTHATLDFPFGEMFAELDEA